MTSLTTYLDTHPLVILGLGREGWSSFHFIRERLPHKHLILIDDKPLEKLKPAWTDIIQANPAEVTFLTSDQALRHPSWLSSDTVILKTPGLPLQHPLSTWLHEQSTLFSSNTALFYEAVTELRQSGTEITIIGVTGTKGKSTTSSFIYHLLQTAQLPALLGGNIGVPPLDLYPELTKLLTEQSRAFVVLEQSCHQLDELQLSPDIAVVQNITPEHLDFYETFERYWSAKSSITRYQTPQNFVIASSDHETAWEMAQLSPGTRLDSRLDDWLEEDALRVGPTSTSRVKIAELAVAGQHTLENITPGLVLADHLQITENMITKALFTFRPLPHRLEHVAEIQNVLFINDSLATTPEAAIAALETFSDRPAVLIAGGYDRHQNFTELANWLATHSVRALILFPPTGQQIAQALAAETQRLGITQPRTEMVEHMADAVRLAQELAQPGDVVLLSPASASFGEFTDYADRGNQFAAQVRALKPT